METTYRILKAKPTTLVICCSDPRFQFAFNCFIQNELDLNHGDFVPIIIAGGPASLAHPAMAKEIRFLNEQIVFFLKHFPFIKWIFLINHEDCGFYTKIPNPGGQKKNREREDLPLAAKALTERISAEKILGIKISSFYAKFDNSDKNEIIFEEI